MFFRWKCDFPTKITVTTRKKSAERSSQHSVEKRCDKNSIDLKLTVTILTCICICLRLITKRFFSLTRLCYSVVNEFSVSSEWPKKVARYVCHYGNAHATGQMYSHWSVLFFFFFIYISIHMCNFFVSNSLLSGYRLFFIFAHIFIY